jgi:hypothetical protein
MSEILTGRTTREIVVSRPPQFGGTGQVTQRVPEGTEVYATVRSDGTVKIRIPGTLFTQEVYLRDVEPF